MTFHHHYTPNTPYDHTPPTGYHAHPTTVSTLLPQILYRNLFQDLPYRSSIYKLLQRYPALLTRLQLTYPTPTLLQSTLPPFSTTGPYTTTRHPTLQYPTLPHLKTPYPSIPYYKVPNPTLSYPTTTLPYPITTLPYPSRLQGTLPSPTPPYFYPTYYKVP